MTAHKISTWLVAGLLLSTTSTVAFGQVNEWVNTPAHDLQLYSPVDFDFDNRPIGKSSGYFFRYDKLSWAFTGERVEIGDPDEFVLSEDIFGQHTDTEGDVPQQYQIQNGIKDAPPDAEFAWGERYELGFFHKTAGWSIGIIDGPEAISEARYGFGSASTTVAARDIAAFTNVSATIALDQVSNANFDGVGFSGYDNAGFGSVHVNFATPPDFLKGFRDYHFNGDSNGANPTNNGPTVRNGDAEDAFLETTINETIIVDGVAQVFATTVYIPNPNADPATETKVADGIPDDLDGDGLPAFYLIQVDTDGDNVVDATVGTGIDFDDLHTFNIRFDTFAVRNVTETQGVEIMRTHSLTNRHKMAKRQGNTLDIAYGVRFLRLRDAFLFEGDGGILGRTFAETKSENQIVGPQIRAMWNRQRGRWNLGVDGRFLFGYNVQDLDQVGAIGENLIPGALNSLISGQPTAFAHGRQENNFSPVVELRADLSYQVTGAIAARLGYTGTFVDNITRASQMVRWALPDMGIREGSGNQEIYINGANFGFDVVY